MAAPSPLPRAAAKAPAVSGTAPRSAAVSAALGRSLFVIPSIDGARLLRRMLPTLHLPPHTVVVLDQGSTDDTEAVCRAAGVRLVQLGRPHTYTEAGNIGARMARDLGCEFVFISNNDIAFTTDVGAELVAALLEDPRLAIAAPSQVIVDERAGERHLAYRVEWHLDAMQFMHDFRPPNAEVERLEADLCELTCAAIRMSAIDEVGFLDDDFGFYHEDADFCFRLRQAGHSCAYLPGSQIEHYTTSTFSAGLSHRKRAYMERNAELFARKHLGYGVGRLVTDHRGDAEPAGGVDRHLPGYLRRFGLIEPGRPALVRRAPGSKPHDYLYLDALPPRSDAAFERLHGYRGLVAGSEAVRRALEDAGFEGVGHAPVGIEMDVFHPWAVAARPYDETTFLLYRPHREGLAAALRAWALFRADRGGARLLVAGEGILGSLAHAPASIRRWGDAVIADYPQDGITLREMPVPPDGELAALFRSVDAVVSVRPAAVAEVAAALACSTLALFPGEGPAGSLSFPGAMTVAGAATAGSWTPDVGDLAGRLREVHDLDRASRRALARAALPLVRGGFTWRSTCAGLSSTLAAWQEPEDVGARLHRLRRAEGPALAADLEEALFGASETGEPHPEAEPRPARVPAPAPPSGAAAEATVRFSRRRRLTEAGRRAYGLWRTGGNGAAARLVGRAVALRARVRLRWLVRRLGGPGR